MKRKAWEYVVALRRDILVAINGIDNAGGYLWWDNTTPNSTTRHRLQKILQNAVRDASAFGVYVVTRHTDCGRRSHKKVSDAHGYVWTDPYNLNVEWQDSRFTWGGDQLFQGMRHGLCPCSKQGEPLDHHVIDDIIYSPDVDPSFYRMISHVLSDIQSAIEEAGDKKPRSGIREYLLRCIIQLNDAIIPVAVEAHIKAQSATEA
ncbi:MAG: hypothetical protein QHC65_06855 [Sphingomonas sp.]|nr:hypothetical protein [Sphingomonas sp.]MDX3884122.1 hypothetical protein [Sphingomonas sp.]